MAYDLLKLFVFDFLCNEDIFASDDLQLLRHLGILSTEHWQDMKTYMTLSALGFRWMGEWRHILMRPVPEPVINCPVARDIRQSHRMNIQRHFREQRDRLMKPSKVTKEELRCLTSSTSEQWKIGIRETQHMLHGQSTPNTLEGIISCLMVAESMRLFGEEKETTPVSRDQYAPYQLLYQKNYRLLTVHKQESLTTSGSGGDWFQRKTGPYSIGFPTPCGVSVA